MKKIACVLLLLGVAVFCAGSGGGEYRPLATVFKDGDITDVVVATVQGYEVQICRRQKLSKLKPRNGKPLGTAMLSEYTYTKLILDFEVIEPIAGGLKRESSHSFSYIEPATSCTYNLLPGGKKEEEMHVIGFVYTGSGKEFKPDTCAILQKVILFLHTDKEGHREILRAEPFSEELAATVCELLKQSKPSENAGQ